MQETWQNGAAYDRYMGRWSRLVAQPFLNWLAAPPAGMWLDVGCGTGSIARLILETQRPKGIFGVDSSAELLAEAQRSIGHPSVHFQVGLAQALDLSSDSVDAAVSGLVLNFVPQPETAVREMLRVTRPGGKIGIFVWDYADGMQMLRYFFDAAVALDPGARQHDEGLRFPICQAGQLEALVRKAGLLQVEAAPIEIETAFRDFDDYWQPFLNRVGPAPVYVAGLSRPDRLALETRLRETLPVAGDGSIMLTARAWAVKGTA